MRSKSHFLCATVLTSMLVCTHAHAALQQGTRDDDVLIGKDDDRVEDLEIQPDPAGANQSLDRADVLEGFSATTC